MVRFLAKVILTLEPTVDKEKFHDDLRAITAHHRSNLLYMIGVDPIVYRSNSSKGEVDLQIWITSTSGNPLNRIILPFYYVGARKYLFMCSTKNSVNFVKEMIELAEDKLNALYEFAILTPASVDKKTFGKMKTAFRKMFREKHLENFSFHHWQQPSDIEEILGGMVEDIVTNMPRDGSYVPIGFNLDTVKNLVEKQGFFVDENNEVHAKVDDVHFRVNLERNIVFADMIDCLDCPKKCKVTKKLCIVISNRGFSTIPGLGDLRMLSVVLAIKDKSIMTLKGAKPQEDIEAQLNDLRKEFKQKCKKLMKIKGKDSVEEIPPLADEIKEMEE